VTSRDPVSIDLASFDAFLFDLDGVITRTAGLHASAWERLFDDHLSAEAQRTGAPFVPFAKDHLVSVQTATVGSDGMLLKVRTRQSEIVIAQAARVRLFDDGRPRASARSVVEEPRCITQDLLVDVVAGRPVTVEKIVALYTSRDRAASECGLEARTAIERAGSFAELLGTHALAWHHLWGTFDMELEVDADPVIPGNGGLATAALVRLHVFHSLQTASPHTKDLDVGVPARGLHGETYRGHVFWDEVFVFPFLNLRMPQITRALLLYRYRRLPEARVAARAAGYRGAMFPWQSGSNGREETDEQFYNPRSGRRMDDDSRLQRHVGAAVAYNVWQYYEVTGDLEFLVEYGAEMLLDTARFWASAATYDPVAARYEIHGMMGPRRVLRPLPRRGAAGLAQQQLHERHGGVGPLAGAGSARRAARYRAATLV
jgi:alpha,alpha-trehalase